MTIVQCLAIAAGGAMGAVCRAGVGLWVRADFPWATLLVNCLGSLLIGFVLGLETGETSLRPSTRMFWVVGFCGSFTTFSTFSYQTVALLTEGRVMAGLTNIALSLLSCLLAVGIGLRLAQLPIFR